MLLFNEHADVSVRPAIPADAHEIARIQLASWGQALADDMGEDTLRALSLDAVSQQWSATIGTNPGPGFHIFTALSAHTIVGFCAVSPGQIVALEVDPLFQREGHGSRLLSAAVDQIRRDGSDEVSTWIPAASSAKQNFFESAGFGESQRVRQLQVDQERSIAEHRWHALIGPQ